MEGGVVTPGCARDLLLCAQRSLLAVLRLLMGCQDQTHTGWVLVSWPFQEIGNKVLSKPFSGKARGNHKSHVLMFSRELLWSVTQYWGVGGGLPGHQAEFVSPVAIPVTSFSLGIQKLVQDRTIYFNTHLCKTTKRKHKSSNPVSRNWGKADDLISTFSVALKHLHLPVSPRKCSQTHLKDTEKVMDTPWASRWAGPARS